MPVIAIPAIIAGIAAAGAGAASTGGGGGKGGEAPPGAGGTTPPVMPFLQVPQVGPEALAFAQRIAGRPPGR